MTSTLVLCDGATESGGRVREGEEPLHLSISGPNANVRLQVENIEAPILKACSPRGRDLLRIAAYAFGADTSVPRMTPKDVFLDLWSRELRLIVPVVDLDFWSAPSVRADLEQTLSFLTGDRFTFEFVRADESQGQLLLKFPPGDTPPGDVVTLFSGGLDSLTAVVEQIHVEGRRPFLVSSRSTSIIDSRQKNLIGHLKTRFPVWSFPHISVWASRKGGRAVETSQRSRAFVFLALGAVVAAELGIDEIRLCDNGVMSINLRKLDQTIGSMATRSTHPVFLKRFERLARSAFRDTIRIVNPFITRTRAEVLEVLRDAGHADLIQEAVSCSRTEGMTASQPHCGTCTQCIDRRFATMGLGLDSHDLPGAYWRDVFVDALKEGEERAYGESFVRSAVKTSGMTPEQFIVEYPEIGDCVDALDGDADQRARELIAMHERHAKMVLEVLSAETAKHQTDLFMGKLPPTCLLALVGSGTHLVDTRSRYARRLGALIADHLPKAFVGSPPTREGDVQRVAEAVFGAANEALHREVPLLPFGAVTTKPDFSDLDGPQTLFVEFKLVKSRDDLRRVVKEMTSRLKVYGDQGASVLFPVYDLNRSITDDAKFRASMESPGKVWVQVVR